MDFASYMLFLWVGIVALQLADLILAVGGVGIAREVSPSYATIVSDLELAADERLDPEALAALHAELATVDDHVGARRVPAGRGAHGHLWIATPGRLVPSVLWLVVAVAVGSLTSSVFAAILVLPVVVISYLLALAAARASLVSRVDRATLQVAHRARAVELLARADRTSKKRVAGLGDRVAKALQILREQQS